MPTRIPYAVDLNAAARADRSKRIGDLVVFSLRFVANCAPRLIAAAASNFFQPKGVTR
jgi:hypothetical protein